MKGTIESGETPGEAALHELAEESGISDAMIERDLGYWKAGHLDQVWSFHLCRAVRELPERWAYQTRDGNGHAFQFFWAPLEDLPYTDCHSVFQRALDYLCETLQVFGRN